MGRWAKREIVPQDAVELLPPDEVFGPSAPPPSVQTADEVLYRYVMSNGHERTACFPLDLKRDCAGLLPSAPSGALREYEDKLKAIDFANAGLTKVQIAERLDRSEHWVKRWWRRDPLSIAKPAVAHGVLVKNAPLLSFRDLDVRRGFLRSAARGAASDDDETAALLAEVLQAVQWEPARRATRDAITGELRVRFDPQGRSITQPGRFVAQYRGGAPGLDRALQHASEVANIRDPAARVFLNRYEDGSATCPTHRHDFWTCMLTLGAERIVLVEDNPMLLRAGDLLVFGTQAHGLPAMPDLGGRRVSVVVFFSPDADGLERRWGMSTGNIDGEGDDDDAKESDTPAQIMCKVVASASAKLVDAEKLGCPGISLGLVARREYHISVPVTVISVGCMSKSEGELYRVLEKYSVRELWDVRPSTSHCALHWTPGEALRQSCATRAIRYRRAPLGRPEAGGLKAHLASEEGTDVLARVVSSAASGQGRDGSTALLFESEDWRSCPCRSGVAAALTRGTWGPVSVLHIGRDGQAEPHDGPIGQRSELCEEEVLPSSNVRRAVSGELPAEDSSGGRRWGRAGRSGLRQG